MSIPRNNEKLQQEEAKPTAKSVPKYRLLLCLVTLAVLLPICIVSLAIATDSGHSDDILFRMSSSLLMTDGWVLSEEDGSTRSVDFPFQSNGNDAWLSNTLPDNLNMEYSLAIVNNHQRLEVLVDDTVIYRYGMNPQNQRFMPGNQLCMVPILPEYSGRRITIHLHTHSILSGQLYLEAASLSTNGEILGQLILQNWYKILFSIVLGTMGVLLLFASFVLYRRPYPAESLPFFHLGCFILLAVLWTQTDSATSQFLFSNSQFCVTLSFITFMLLPVPLLLFMDRLCQQKTRGLIIVSYLLIGNLGLQLTCYILGISHFMVMLPLTHGLILLSVFLILYCMIREILTTKSFYAKWILIGMSLFVAISCLALVSFYRSRGRSYDSFFMLGFALFAIIMVFLCIRKFSEMVHFHAKAGIYQEMAFTDALTGLGNRMLYENRLKQLEQEFKPDCTVSVVMLDINCLKRLNDTEGHSAGDRLIQDAANCIQRTFGPAQGECFRIGGDEFLAILWGQTVSAVKYRKLLELALSECNKHRSFPLSMSVGFAVKESDNLAITSLTELIQNADKDMYHEKDKYHLGRS